MPEWLVEHGIGENRAVLLENGEIIAAQIELDGAVPAGSVIAARLLDIGRNGRNAVAVAEGGVEFLLPRGASNVTQGGTFAIEVTRGPIPGTETWKRPLAKVTDKTPAATAALRERLDGRDIILPSSRDELVGWNDIIDEARTGIITFAGGELRVSATPAMTLIDVDGYLAPEELAILGAGEAARAIRRLDIGGSIGIDLPTVTSKSVRQRAAEAIDATLPQPFERTAVNGFGFVQIIRPRSRASLVELAQDRAPFESRALLRQTAFESAGPRRLVAHPAIIGMLESRPEWLQALARQLGGNVGLRADPDLPMSAGYAETV